jgi:uncharacterized protein (DUF58 family)
LGDSIAGFADGCDAVWVWGMSGIRAEIGGRGRRPRRGRLRLTPRGWVFAVVCLVLAGGARWAGEPALMHIGLLGGFVLGAAGFVAAKNLDRVTYSRQVPKAVFAGSEFVVELRVTNSGRWADARCLETNDEVLGPFGKGMSVGRLRAGEAAGGSFATWLRHRGIDPTFRWKISSTFPCGLWRATRFGRTQESLVVYPRPVAPFGIDDAGAADLPTGEENWVPLPDFSGEYLGIREFRPGDPLKMIHWRATARIQRLVVREFDRRLPVRYALFFHSYHPPGEPRLGDAFESALELLAGLLMECRTTGLPLELTADFNGWRAIEMTASQNLSEPLKLLAGARWTPSAEIDGLIGALRNQPPENRVFIVSDTPARLWQSLLPDLQCDVTCLSVGHMRKRQPHLTFTKRA